MNTAEASELRDVMNRIKDWPAARRITLARRILESVDTSTVGGTEPESSTDRPMRGVPVESVVGLLRTDSEPPTDEECRQIVEEERWKKYGR
jgi:hypothetical protein